MYRDGVDGNTSAGGRLIETGDRVLLPIIERVGWRGPTTGDRAELRDLPEDLPLWKEIAAEAETCLGTECPRYGDCFVTLMRQRAAESDVVIVNHHLLCADAAVRQSEYGEVIPSCPTLVVDEAHQLEDVATQYFGCSFSNYRVDDLVRDAASGWRAPRRRSLASAGDEVDRPRALHARRRTVARRSSRRCHGTRGGGRRRRDRASATRPRRMAEHFEDGMMLAGRARGPRSRRSRSPRRR